MNKHMSKSFVVSDDIVTRLRQEWEYGNNAKGCDYEMFAQAADEIERWQDIARRLYLFIQDPCTHNHWCDVCSSVDAYKKAVNDE